MQARIIARSMIAACMALAMACASRERSENPATWTEARAAEWFDSHDWESATAMRPDPSINKKKFAVQYHLHQARWDSAFAFMRRGNFSALPPGNIPLLGDDAFVKVSEYSTKNPEDAFYEEHRDYADIHFVVSGEEKIGAGDVAGAKVRTPYDPGKDILFYEGVEGREMIARPGTFYIFFPGEGHRPGVATGESAPVKKIVVKVRS